MAMYLLYLYPIFDLTDLEKNIFIKYLILFRTYPRELRLQPNAHTHTHWDTHSH